MSQNACIFVNFYFDNSTQFTILDKAYRWLPRTLNKQYQAKLFRIKQDELSLPQEFE